MTAELIAVGTEILLGSIANTDAQDVSRALSELGIDVFFHTVVGDNPERLKRALDVAKSRSDIIITTGGLGPTYDDLTKETLAEAFGVPLTFREEQAQRIRDFFETRHGGEPFTENNFRQAYLPEGCTVFENGNGTAPGCAFVAEGKHVLMLPGPPRECRAMLQSGAIPYLRGLSDARLFTHNIHIFGERESAVEYRLHELMTSLTNPTLAPYAKEGEVLLRLTAKAASEEEAERMMAPVLEAVRAELGDLIYGVDTDSLEATVSALLAERGQTVATAESCTGGLLAKRITDVPGASRVFPGGVIAYSAEVKTALLGVPAELIAKHGVVSREVALAMAEGARLRLGADYGLGTTGVAGPGADADGNPEGTVFVALSAEGVSEVLELNLTHERERIRGGAAAYALDILRKHLNIPLVPPSGTSCALHTPAV
jgi:nicotinamide-nucleotide amidase